MIPAIVFSRDRGCQLDALLSTLPDVFGPVSVLYRATRSRFADGYDACMLYHPAVAFYPETYFRTNVEALLPRRGLVCFFTDDDLVFGPVDGPTVQQALDDPSVVAFSLRLGSNTSHCYPHDRAQRIPTFERRAGHVVWGWPDAELDFGYPLSLDGHVLRADDVRRGILGAGFRNPNELEDLLAHGAHRLVWRPLLASFPHSVLVGVPANRVNDSHPNRHGGSDADSPAVLNERFLAGWRIDPKLMRFSDVNAAHAEIPYILSQATPT